MPTYEYSCNDCGDRLDVVQSFTDDSLTVCPTCGGQLRKLFGNVGVVFKGSGFYRNDSRAGANQSGDQQSGESQSGDTEKQSGATKSDSSGSADKGSADKGKSDSSDSKAADSGSGDKKSAAAAKKSDVGSST